MLLDKKYEHHSLLNSCSQPLSTGEKYVGDWKDSTQHGKGTFKWSNGNQYIGDWKRNKRHGKQFLLMPMGFNSLQNGKMTN